MPLRDLQKLQQILATHFKPTKTPRLGAYPLKHRCAELGLPYMTEEQFINEMELLEHYPTKNNQFYFTQIKKPKVLRKVTREDLSFQGV